MLATDQLHTGIRANSSSSYRICYSESKISDLTQVHGDYATETGFKPSVSDSKAVLSLPFSAAL